MIYDVKAYLHGLRDTYREEIQSGLDFWAEHGVDWEKGGIVTYLDRRGNWYLDEKQGWFTGRAMYCFARGYHDICKRERWLEAALNIYNFLAAHQFAPDGRLYYNMSRDGAPCDTNPIGGSFSALMPSLHCESFAVMGLSELYRVTGRQDVKETLLRIFDMQQRIYRNPEYVTTGKMRPPGTPQPKVPLAWLMSLLCSVQTLRQALPENKEAYTALLSEYIGEIFKYYWDDELQTLMEAEIDCPGHNMEVAWFMLAEGLYTGDKALVERCARIVGDIYRYGWDHEWGGLYLHVNMRGNPGFVPTAPLKYWWPNNETEIGLMYAFIGTGDLSYLEKYRKVHEWVFAHFPDRDEGEWFGYLNRDGTPISTNKGDNQKGPYHLYRSFFAIHDVIGAYLEA